MQTGMFLGGALAALVLIAAPVWAGPHTYGFSSITNNNAGDVAIGEAQLSVDVSDPGAQQVLFTFRNEGPDASSIARIYFDDFGGLLSGIGAIEESDGVSFSHAGQTGARQPGRLGRAIGPQSAGPPILPGGNEADPSFQVTPGLLASADAGRGGVPEHGVNPGEWVEILMNLSDGHVIEDVLAGIHSGALRIGLHVIGFAGGGSESFVIVPAPGAALLGLMGLGAAGLKLRKRL